MDLSMLPDELFLHIHNFVGLPFKDELLRHAFKRYFSFYVTHDRHIRFNKKWGPDNYLARKTLMLTRDANGGYRGLGTVHGKLN
jgi:hypothetical protein